MVQDEWSQAGVKGADGPGGLYNRAPCGWVQTASAATLEARAGTTQMQLQHVNRLQWGAVRALRLGSGARHVS